MDLTAGLVVEFIASKWNSMKSNAIESGNWLLNEDTKKWKKNCHQTISLGDGKSEACFQNDPYFLATRTNLNFLKPLKGLYIFSIRYKLPAS